MSTFTRASTLVVVATLLATVPFAASASTASILSSTDNNSRVPLVPLSVSDTDYPLPSLVANEEGRTVLAITIAPDGRVIGARVAGSSGFLRLDEAAIEIAKVQWVFWPKDGAVGASPDTMTLHVDWVLPLEDISASTSSAASKAALDQPSFPNGVPPRLFSQVGLEPSVTAAIPLDGALLRLRILVKEDGKPGEVEVVVSSGVPRLDEGTRQLILNRWVYRPATVNGVPVESWVTANMRFEVSQDVRPPAECRDQPRLAAERVPRTSLFGSLTLRRQVFANEDGRVQSALLLTQKGWMKLSEDLLQLNHPIHFEPKPTKNGRPAKCWYDADVTVKVR